MNLESKINYLLDELLTETKESINRTYFDTCNRDFRQHPNYHAKATILFETYSFQPIKISENASIRIIGVGKWDEEEFDRTIAPYEVTFLIESGENTISRLMAFQRMIIKKYYPWFSTENGHLIIHCGSSNLNRVINDDVDVVLSKTISGGKETIFEAVEIVNRKDK